MRASKASGFTLTEMLVVIAIIGILASILFPTLARVKEQGRQTQCTSNLQQIAAAIEMYGHDWNERYPPAESTENGVRLTWQDFLEIYVKDERLYQCPSAQIEDPTTEFSYAMNRNLAKLRHLQVGNSQEVVMFYDSKDLGPDDPPGDTGDPPYDNYAGDQARTFLDERHNDGAVFVFADGHADWKRDFDKGESIEHWEP
jgi:prepilin-type N-terminal cleavage/methylation domain-containing protein/prepilin-type processing-associated H-X9-DG protein